MISQKDHSDESAWDC